MIFRDTAKRNVFLLAVCQGLSSTGLSMLAAVAALAGHMLAEDKAFATLPLAVMWTATMVTTIPAAHLMAHVGRRVGLSVGALCYIAGGLSGFYALWVASFPLFFVTCGLLGVANGFAQYYRFAAVDSVPVAFKSKAIAYVLTGGVAAAFLGPELAKSTINWFLPYLYAGSYAAV